MFYFAMVLYPVFKDSANSIVCLYGILTTDTKFYDDSMANETILFGD